MNIKVKGLVVAVVFVIAAFVLGVVIFTFAAKEDSAAVSIVDGETPCYVLRDYQGYVAVFMENRPRNPMTLTAVEVTSLRDYDRIKLQTGIKIYSREKLMMTLEDFNS